MMLQSVDWLGQVFALTQAHSTINEAVIARLKTRFHKREVYPERLIYKNKHF
jgi:hypothetical protein